jgi:hypothetical protein
LKNNYTGLFIVGIILGGTSMLFMIAFMNISNSSDQMAAPSPTRDSLPHLIALEPTSARQKTTQTPVSQTIATEPSLAPVKTTSSSTPTALALLNEQQSEIIGYSVEGRPLEVYTFGDGEHERMLVAGIHGGDEWNTVTLATSRSTGNRTGSAAAVGITYPPPGEQDPGRKRKQGY